MSAEKTGSLLPKISKKDAKMQEMQDGIDKLKSFIHTIQQTHKREAMAALMTSQNTERDALETKQNNQKYKVLLSELQKTQLEERIKLENSPNFGRT